MWIVFLLSALILITGIIIKFKPAANNNSVHVGNIQDTSKVLNKADIMKRLKEISEKEVSGDLNSGAMCYKMAGPPERAEYVCPACGEKTIYNRDLSRFIERELPACRDVVKQIKKINVQLDESQFCKKCGKNNKNPGLCCTVKISGNTEVHTSCDINSEDLKLIKEFTEGTLIHNGERNEQTPLKNYIDRIEGLLGIKMVK